MSRGRGIGFFEAGNFYPDFILWLLIGGKQYVSFVDPKGIRNLEGADDPKISFFQTVKQLELRLADPEVMRWPFREVVQIAGVRFIAFIFIPVQSVSIRG